MYEKLNALFIKHTGNRHLSEILSGSMLSFATRILSVILGLVTNLIIAKYYGSEILGTLSIVLSVMMVASMFGLLGMDVSILRFIPPAVHKKAYHDAYVIWKKVFTLIIVSGAMIFALLFTFDDFIASFVFQKPYLASILGLTAFFVFMKVIGEVSTATIRAFQDIRTYLIVQLLPSVINVTILLIITFFFYTAYNPIYSQFASVFLVAVVSLVLLQVLLRKNRSGHSEDTAMTYTEILTISWPMFMTAAMNMILAQTDIVMLGRMCTLEEVGVYTIAMKLAMLSSFVIQSINTIIAPKFSELYYSDNLEELENVSRKSTMFIFYATLPITLVLVVFGNQLLALFGEEFIMGYFALVLLSIGMLINAMAGPIGYFLNMTGHQRTLNKVVLIGGICNIVLNLLLIPAYGIYGAALASMISVILWNVLASLYIKKYFGFFVGYIPLVNKVK